MFKLFKRKNKIKELENKVLILESDLAKLKAHEGYLSFARKQTTVTVENDGLLVSINKPELLEKIESGI